MSAETSHYIAIINIKQVEVITRERRVEDVLSITVRAKTLSDVIDKAAKHLEAEYPLKPGDA